ncbi:group II truncated hemoglobin [Novosphingobium album (ex Hu et al. 2023)]|uniref:Group II truncated hemoglobin n=1 Tax=Novosphingobium album (ex Hu et al. 2023) TaxID=2930093 RepID=A0ABT0AYC7_9SPHN|nr:group II truncated hemoglobin [Novosphingobium album (ex Hu et al. 2023)]MCJ2177797.1 group II truncated hemoglobin [Novosphingobium album (ex Hu et al. 2023)]
MTEANVSMFERIGGEHTIDRLVESFYHRMDTLVEARGIRDMHDPDLEPVKRVLKRYLTEWLGGPDLYSSERGHPRLRQRHMGFPIGDAARDAWMLCMDGALAETVADEGACQNIRESMKKLADWMRNRQDAEEG